MDKIPDTYMSVLDAISIFKRAPNKNDRPYDALVKKANNNLLDNAKTDVLDRKSTMSGGRLLASSVWPLIDIYQNGVNMLDLGKYMKFLPRMTDEQVAYWIAFFEKPMEEILNCERATIITGWNVLMTENELRLAEEKLVIFEKSDDPLVWHTEMLKTKLYQKKMVFWPNMEEYNKVYDKVQTIINNPIKPFGR